MSLAVIVRRRTFEPAGPQWFWACDACGRTNGKPWWPRLRAINDARTHWQHCRSAQLYGPPS